MKVYGIKTGLATEGVDLGGPSAQTVKKANVAMLIGEGVTNNDAGEMWHLLDQHYDMQLTMIDVQNIGRANLSGYSAIIMPDGSFSPTVAAKIKDYANGGGTLIAFGRAVKFLKTNDLANVDFKVLKNFKTTEKKRPYDKLGDDEGAQVIGGAIFEADADLTHPLLYGYHNPKIPVFRSDTMYMEPTANAYATPLVYTQNPLLSGYLSLKNKEMARGAASIVVSASGSGRAICMIDNPAFRAFWFGTNKLLANMIFFGNLIQTGALETAKSGEKK